MVNSMSGWAFVHFKDGKGGMQECFSPALDCHEVPKVSFYVSFLRGRLYVPGLILDKINVRSLLRTST